MILSKVFLLWFTSQVREHAILLNLGSLRAIAMRDCVLIFDYNRYPSNLKVAPYLFVIQNSTLQFSLHDIFSPGGQAFIESLLPRLNPKNLNGAPEMPFELEVSNSCKYMYACFI